MPVRTMQKETEGVQVAGLPHPRELAPFLRRAPLPVLVRSCLEWLIDAKTLEQLFQDTADKQYTRDLTLGFMVYLMLDVACGIQSSAGAALKAHREEIDVSRQAFYGKLNRMEPAVGAAIVKHIADLADTLIQQLHGPDFEPILGYQVRVVDGTFLGGRTDHRIELLRKTKSAGLTGMALAVFAPVSGLVRQVVLQEDAYTQERSVLDQLDIRAGETWIADRNFCVRSFLFRIHRAQSTFLIRWHGSSCPYQEIEALHPAAHSKLGAMEHLVRLQDPQTAQWLTVRRIVLPLEQPTRNGDPALILVTDLPQTIMADDLCHLYRGRWQIETHYQRLTQQLHCEPSGLNQPRAALFAFAMAATAANALAVVQRALEAQHGWEAVQELSYYQVVYDVDHAWVGMDIAVPTPLWAFIRRASAGKMGEWLLAVAKLVPMQHYTRSKRGPKRPQPKRQSGKHHQHVSIKRLLDQANLHSAC